MPISVTCNGCQAKLNAPDAAAGKRVKCPKCGGVISIPAAVAPEYEVVEDASPAPAKARKPQMVDEDEKPRAKKPRVEDDEKPRKKAARADDEDERPRKKKAAVEDDDEKPRRRKARDESDEDDARPRNKKGKKGGMVGLVIGLVVMLILVPAVAAVVYFQFFANNGTAAVTTKPGPVVPIGPGPVGPGPVGPSPTPVTTPTTQPGDPNTGPKWQSLSQPALSADGTRVIGIVGSFANPESIGEWEVATGKKLGEFGRKEIKGSVIFRIAYSGSTTQDSKVAAYASTAKMILVWDAKTHELVKEVPITLDGFDTAFPGMKFFAFTADASALLMHGANAVARVDIASGKQEFILKGKVEFDTGSFAAAADTVVASGGFKIKGLRVTTLKTPDDSEDIELPKELEGSEQVVSADGSTVAFRVTDSKTEKRQIVLYSLKEKKVTDTVQMPGNDQKPFVTELALSDDGSVLAFVIQKGGGFDRKFTVAVYTTTDKATRLVPQEFSDQTHISLAGNGSKLAIGHGFKPMLVLDVATLR
jgi:hypothetical protein